MIQSGHGEKSFIDRINFKIRSKSGQRFHDPAGNITVECVIGRKKMNIMFLQKMLDLETWGAPCDTECFEFIGERDYNTVIIGENANRFTRQLGIEYPLAGSIEIVAVH
jgi:hypothetical protein